MFKTLGKQSLSLGQYKSRQMSSRVGNIFESFTM